MWLLLSLCTWAEHPEKPHVSTFGYESILIQPNSFAMGSPKGDVDEIPHEVAITRPYYMGTTEVTVGFWKKVMGTAPWESPSTECIRIGSEEPIAHRFPVYCVDWFDAARFANQLSDWERLEQCYHFEGERLVDSKGPACLGYRLPTEAEWEYAAQATRLGTETLQELEEKLSALQKKYGRKKTIPRKFRAEIATLEAKIAEYHEAHKAKEWPYAGGSDVRTVGWYQENSNQQAQMTGLLKANRAGIHDMSGNLWEWCHDWYGSYDTQKANDPVGSAYGTYRVLRGGSFASSEKDLRLHNRFRQYPTTKSNQIGFRLVRTASPLPKLKREKDKPL